MAGLEGRYRTNSSSLPSKSLSFLELEFFEKIRKQAENLQLSRIKCS